MESSTIFKPFCFHLKNDKLSLKEIININFFKLLCEVNKKLIENIHYETINENKIHVFIVMKHLFKDIGIPQYLLKLIISFDESLQKFNIEIDNTLEFILPFQYNVHSKPLDNTSLSCCFTKITENEYNYTIHIQNNLKDNVDEDLDDILEKVVIKLINSIFNNLNKYINEYIC